MTTESTQPQPELGSPSGTGQGQSQGHRRRRRRKNKSSQAGAQAQPMQQQPGRVPSVEGQAAPPPQQRPVHRQHQGQGQGQQGRKKKFFQKKNSGPAPQPGNNYGGQQQGGGSKQRKNRQKTPREFVGPMDHSYRAANGNMADTPPSTIPTSGNGHSSNYYADAYPAQKPKEDAPTRIFCFIEDLFFMAKIQETARKLGIKVEFIKGDKEAIARLTDAPENERPALVVFDLNNVNVKPMTLIPKLKTKLKKATSIIGFLNHLQGDLKLKAIEAGCDTVMPRSAFSQSLPNLLRRYGMEEEDEYCPQPV